MIRRLMLGAGVLALLMSAISGVGGSVASATSGPVVMSGTISCHVTGTFFFGTPLTNGGVAQTTMSLVADLSNCTGSGTTTSGVTITSGTLTANPISTVTNNCGQVLAGLTLPKFFGKIQWAASVGTAADTKLHFDTPFLFDNVGVGRLLLGLPTTMKQGSYAQPGSTATFARLYSDSFDWQLTNLCATGSAGLQTIPFGQRQDSTIAKGGIVTFKAGV
jgi:hypothetical protein